MGLFNIFKKKKQKEVKPQVTEAQKPKDEIKARASTIEKPKAEAKPAAAPKPTAKIAQKPAAKAQPQTAKPKSEPTQKAEEKKEAAPKKATPAGKFEIKKSKDDRYVFNLYAANKVIVATSQVYSSSSSALNGIKSVIENAGKAPIEDQTLKSYETLPYPKWEIYQDKGGAYRFRLNASNGSCICHSQGYTSKASCKNGIESIKKTSKDAAIDKSYLKKD